MRKTSSLKKALLSLFLIVSVVTLAACSGTAGGGGGGGGNLIIYSNADEEAIAAIENSLDSNGLEGQYTIQTFGTSELGGKLLAEGTNTEADIVTMSSYYLDSAQEQNNMFASFEPEVQIKEDFVVDQAGDFYYPITVQEGSLFYNTQLIEEEGLATPASYKDLANPEYAGKLSISDINASSTAWLMVQALIDNYGEEEATSILTDIYSNAGDQLQDSGSGPLKAVRGGEVPIGAGLRHQAVRYKNDGEPVDYQDPEEGTYLLTESIALIDKGEETKTELATQAINAILTDGRQEILQYYPVAVYEGEETNADYAAGEYKTFPEPLTTELLEQHVSISDKAKEAAGLK